MVDRIEKTETPHGSPIYLVSSHGDRVATRRTRAEALHAQAGFLATHLTAKHGLTQREIRGVELKELRRLHKNAHASRVSQGGETNG